MSFSVRIVFHIGLRLKRSNDFQAIVSFFRLRNTLIIDNSYTLNFSATTNLKQMLLPLFVKSFWCFFFDNISFGFVVVLCTKQLTYYSTSKYSFTFNGKLNSIYTSAIYCRVQPSITLSNNSPIQDYNHSINIRFSLIIMFATLVFSRCKSAQ